MKKMIIMCFLTSLSGMAQAERLCNSGMITELKTLQSDVNESQNLNEKLAKAFESTSAVTSDQNTLNILRDLGINLMSDLKNKQGRLNNFQDQIKSIGCVISEK